MTNRLSVALTDQTLPPVDRAALLLDAYALAKAGMYVCIMYILLSINYLYVIYSVVYNTILYMIHYIYSIHYLQYSIH